MQFQNLTLKMIYVHCYNYNNCFQKWQLERKFERNSFKQSEKGNVL